MQKVGNSSVSSLFLFHIMINRQYQTVQTNFRIDNISAKTKFTELPEAAQAQLDEIEKYIRAEGQRAEHIMKRMTPKHLEDMNQTKLKTESLSQVKRRLIKWTECGYSKYIIGYSKPIFYVVPC